MLLNYPSAEENKRLPENIEERGEGSIIAESDHFKIMVHYASRAPFFEDQGNDYSREVRDLPEGEEQLRFLLVPKQEENNAVFAGIKDDLWRNPEEEGITTVKMSFFRDEESGEETMTFSDGPFPEETRASYKEIITIRLPELKTYAEAAQILDQYEVSYENTPYHQNPALLGHLKEYPGSMWSPVMLMAKVEAVGNRVKWASAPVNPQDTEAQQQLKEFLEALGKKKKSRLAFAVNNEGECKVFPITEPASGKHTVFKTVSDALEFYKTAES